MEIQSGPIMLRDYCDGDFEAVHEYGADPEFSKYELWGPNSEKDTRDFLLRAGVSAQKTPRFQFELAVCLLGQGENEDTPKLIGGCGLRRESENSRIANMGWAINPRFQGQGYATHAARALMAWGVENLELKVVYATCDTRNIASYRVMEKLGMKRVGLLKGKLKVKGYLRDSYRYELVF